MNLLFRSDGKRHDGLTLIPWQRGLSLTWDVTVATTLADSYISASASSAGAAAEMAASRKAKYAALSGSFMLQPIAMETLVPINESAVQFLNDLCHRITSVSADHREGQSSNDSLLLCRDLTLSRCMSRLEVMTTRTFSRPAFLICLSFNHRDLYYRGYYYYYYYY